MSDRDQAAPTRLGKRLTDAAWLRLATALVALAAGVAALVIAIDLVRGALS